MSCPVLQFNEGARISRPPNGAYAYRFERSGMTYDISAEALAPEREPEDPQGLEDYIRQKNAAGEKWPMISQTIFTTNFLTRR